MNLSDSERISAILSKTGKETSNISEANLVVVNMCSVRQSAVDRIHGLVEKFKKLREKNSKLKTILTGCILKKDKKSFEKKFDYVLNTSEALSFAGLTQPRQLGVARSATGAASIKASEPQEASERVRKNLAPSISYVPIMTGCNNFCSYCVVPYTRGREVSRPAKEIISEIKNLIKDGAKEIWLLGQNVNSYKDTPRDYDRSHEVVTFPKLLKIINKIPGEFWIRFTSSHPKDFSDDLITAMKNCEKLPKYLNLPVQSGDDKILKKMNRPYSALQYKNLVKKIRKAMPDISLSTDIIVGFPGETKKQFENTAKLFREVKFDMAYINKYSPRAGTAAAKLKDNIPLPEKKRREKILTEILKTTALSHNKKLAGEETLVLINENRGDNYFGKNEHYKTIKIKSDKNLLGKLVKVKITETQPFILNGELL